MAAEQLESMPLLAGGGGAAAAAGGGGGAPPPAAQQMLLNAAGGGKQRRLSAASASANLVNTIVGAGMMALPAAYLSLGLVGGSAVMALVGAMTYFTLDILARSTVLTDCWTYGDLARVVMGKAHASLLKGSIVFNNFGLLTAYMIIIADILVGADPPPGAPAADADASRGVLPMIWPGVRAFRSRAAVMAAVAALLILPNALRKRMDGLKVQSVVSMSLATSFIVLTVALAALKLWRGEVSPELKLFPDFDRPAVEVALTLITAVPILMTALVCHYNAHPIFAEIRKPTMARLRAVTSASVSGAAVIYVAIGIFGYTLFNKDTKADVMQNYVRANIAGLVGSRAAALICDAVRVAYALSLILSFPLVNFGMRDNIFLMIDGWAQRSRRGARAATAAAPQGGVDPPPAVFYAVTVLTMVATYLAFLLIPDIWIAFELVGGTAAVYLAYVLPCLIQLELYPAERGRANGVFAYVIIFFGAVVALCAVYQTAKDVASARGG